MFEEIQSAVIFPLVLAIHEDLLSFMPFEIPQAEQTYFVANVYSLLLEQPEIVESWLPPFTEGAAEG